MSDPASASGDGDSVGGQRIAAARAYVDALVSHDPSGVNLHPDCTRVEMGIKTGRSGSHIARSLARGPQFRLIHRVSGFTATVEGHTVSTKYRVHVVPRALGLWAPVSESFLIDDEFRIRTIVARFGLPRRR
ncbi:hypothetical protein [Gordonia otitidis]|uniref:DUF8021 domain-containing protein n=1 Tax=Gordonia otitidis (strain DSM 44809 / CCUG 52243 / JCM 12355 / NBRC 100426 / IFM 10032) TaxID=1108044 RepID=H5TQ60_GORO1|nr:hypothetical protein [Gordonia otitidis]UEA57684.1 hypothetical protein LK459_13765 [Gordonia otitidis]GAB35618.1 hypothetical protein GOOTI_170_00850 [Gordonia otitidis NBRC 100426]